MRIAVKFIRTGLGKYVSHLDMQRLFSRALKRTALPVKYSSGFNPHINLSFASALAVGMESCGEYLEFQTTGDVDTKRVLIALNETLPAGFRAVACGVLPDGEKKLMAATDRAEYRVLPRANEGRFIVEMDKLMACGEYVAEKKKEGKTRKVDIRPLIYGCSSLDGGGELLMLALSGEKSLSPMFLMEALKNGTGLDFEPIVVRTEIYFRSGDRILPLMELFEEKTEFPFDEI